MAFIYKCDRESKLAQRLENVNKRIGSKFNGNLRKRPKFNTELRPGSHQPLFENGARAPTRTNIDRTRERSGNQAHEIS